MADAGSTATAVVDAVKKALEGATTNEGIDVGAPEKPATVDTTPQEAKAGLDAGTMDAVARFRKTIRWMLGAFAAVGLVVFGSVPFTDITGDGRKAWLILVGLGLAGLGLALAVWAVSRVSEPEDASLGELVADFGTVEPSDDSIWHSHRKRALARLKQMLTVNDPQNHLGPGYQDVTDPVRPHSSSQSCNDVRALISALGKADADHYKIAGYVAALQVIRDTAELRRAASLNELQAAWDRFAKQPSPQQEEQDDDEQLPKNQAPMEGQLLSALQSLLERIDIRPTASTRSPETPADAASRAAAAAVVEAYARWTADRNAAIGAAKNYEAAAARLAAISAQRAVHLEHRDMIIYESAATQLRGTFRSARLALLFGVLAMVFGTILYVLGLPQEQDNIDPDTVTAMRFTPDVPLPDDGTPVTIRIRGITGDLARCNRVKLQGRLIGNAGASTEVVTSNSVEGCAGQWILPVGSWVQTGGANIPSSADTSSPTDTSTTTTTTSSAAGD